MSVRATGIACAILVALACAAFVGFVVYVETNDYYEN